MKINSLIKASPFLSTLLLIIFLSITNQKEDAKLRILIWDTPSLSFGSYLAISTGTGFILSYLITTNLANIKKSKPKEKLKFKDEVNNVEPNDYDQTYSMAAYDNTLIERDIKEPSPKINANFRLIGRTQPNKRTIINNINKNEQYDESMDFDELYDEESEKDKIINNIKQISSDWNYESYSRWYTKHNVYF